MRVKIAPEEARACYLAPFLLPLSEPMFIALRTCTCFVGGRRILRTEQHAETVAEQPCHIYCISLLAVAVL